MLARQNWRHLICESTVELVKWSDNTALRYRLIFVNTVVNQ
jgi:hypothetical protein